MWIGDITYLTTLEGWLYPTIVVALRSRRVIAWALRHTLADRRAAAGSLSHSDRWSQHPAHNEQALLAAHAMVPSMSRTGDCCGSAVADSFFATRKREIVNGLRWCIRDGAHAAIFIYMVIWYNRNCRHSGLGYVSPIDYALQQTSLPQTSKAG